LEEARDDDLIIDLSEHNLSENTFTVRNLALNQRNINNTNYIQSVGHFYPFDEARIALPGLLPLNIPRNPEPNIRGVNRSGFRYGAEAHL
jgi:hypothetical protein